MGRWYKQTVWLFFYIQDFYYVLATCAGSQHDQWQAMEGVGVVAFHENRLHRAEKYFTMALDTLKAAPEATSVAWDRIMRKLQDVKVGNN